MTNPWDRPLLPTYGDTDPNKLYDAVGRMPSAWEAIEFDLCRIFSIFAKDPDGEAMRRYGSSRALPRRLDAFSNQAETYFVDSPNQNREIELHQLLNEIKGFYERRNEVIHGIVLPINNLDYYKQYLTERSLEPPQYAVIPPYYMVRGYGVDGFPLYGYNEAMIIDLLQKMWNIHERLNAFRESLVK